MAAVSYLPAVAATTAPVLADETLTVEEAARLRTYADGSKADATWRAYRSDWRCFTRWCVEQGRQPLPAAPETVALYLEAHAELRAIATLQRRLSSIAQHHQAAGHPSPTHHPMVKVVWEGIRRTHGRPQRAVAPATTDVIRAMVATLDSGRLIGVRDRALLLLGFAGAFRRSELVSLDVADIVDCEEGLRVTLRRSKTDQEGRGYTKGIPYGSNPATCPVRAWRAWLEASGITDGPAFRSVDRHGRLGAARLADKTVALVVKRTIAAAGLDPADYSGHSLRAGLATAAALAGLNELAIMEQTGHKSTDMVRRYIRHGRLFHNNAAAAVGL
jgi:integrase